MDLGSRRSGKVFRVLRPAPRTASLVAALTLDPSILQQPIVILSLLFSLSLSLSLFLSLSLLENSLFPDAKRFSPETPYPEP